MFRFLEQLFCPHKDKLTRRDSDTGRMWTECMNCGKESDGVTMGRIATTTGHDGPKFQYSTARGTNPAAWIKA